MTTVIINPGTEPIQEETSVDNAWENIKQLIKDTNVSNEKISIKEKKELHDHFGRYAFAIYRNGYKEKEIMMPGLPLEKVRFLGAPQNPWHFPRLYINGSSFLWKFVVDLLWCDEDEDSW